MVGFPLVVLLEELHNSSNWNEKLSRFTVSLLWIKIITEHSLQPRIAQPILFDGLCLGILSCHPPPPPATELNFAKFFWFRFTRTCKWLFSRTIVKSSLQRVFLVPKFDGPIGNLPSFEFLHLTSPGEFGMFQEEKYLLNMLNETPGQHRHIFCARTLLKVPFRRMESFSRKILSSANFVNFSKVIIFFWFLQKNSSIQVEKGHFIIWYEFYSNLAKITDFEKFWSFLQKSKKAIVIFSRKTHCLFPEKLKFCTLWEILLFQSYFLL